MTWRGDASGARHNCDVKLEPRREAYRNTRERVREKTVDGEVTKATDHTCPSVNHELSNVVNTLTKDENMPEANSNEDNEMPKLTVFDDYEEMMKGRQKELNSQKEMGAMTVVKRIRGVNPWLLQRG